MTESELDVRRRLTFVESTARFIFGDDFPECQLYRLPLLMRQLKDELDMLKQEVLAWIALEVSSGRD